jgi:type I restriction enzyme S subunit
LSASRHSDYLGALPSDWETVPLDELGDIVGGGTPSRNNPSFWGGGILWVTPSEITELGTKVLSRTRETITPSGLAGSAARLLPQRALLITTRATIGAVAIAGAPVATNQGFRSLVCNATADPDFYFHLLRHIASELSRLGSGSTFDEISRTDVGRIVVPRPPLDEQRRVAAVLDEADRLLEETDAVMDKLQLLRSGLIRTLLSRGVDDQGRLRPFPDGDGDAESPLGALPHDWELRRLADLSLNRGDYGSGAAAKPFDPKLPRYVRITDIRDDGTLSDETFASITENEARGYELETNDLLFARSGATVGKTYLYDPDDGRCAHAGYVIKFRLDPQRCVPRYVAHFTRSPFYWRWVGRTLRQGAQPNINADEYRELLLPCPPLPEQERIAATLDAVDERIHAEARYGEKLKLGKDGLAADLLSGTIRAPSAIEPAAAVAV